MWIVRIEEVNAVSGKRQRLYQIEVVAETDPDEEWGSYAASLHSPVAQENLLNCQVKIVGHHREDGLLWLLKGVLEAFCLAQARKL